MTHYTWTETKTPDFYAHLKAGTQRKVAEGLIDAYLPFVEGNCMGVSLSVNGENIITIERVVKNNSKLD